MVQIYNHFIITLVFMVNLLRLFINSQLNLNDFFLLFIYLNFYIENYFFNVKYNSIFIHRFMNYFEIVKYFYS